MACLGRLHYPFTSEWSTHTCVAARGRTGVEAGKVEEEVKQARLIHILRPEAAAQQTRGSVGRGLPLLPLSLIN